MEEQYSQLVEEKAASVSIGKRKIGKVKYTSLQKTYNILSYGVILKNHKYTLSIDEIKLVLLMQLLREKL